MGSPPEPEGRPGRALAGAALLLVLPLLVLFSETLFGDRVLSPTDALYDFQPWRTVRPEGYRPGNPLLLDQALLMRPWLEYSAERVAAGELPLWNPYDFCGQPITAAVTGATYWPLHWLYYAYPTPRYHALSATVRLLAAGVFTLLFLRCLGVRPLAGLAGATAFMLSGFMIAWLNHPHTNAALCLPLLLWLVERVAARPTWSRAAWLAPAIALPLLGGHLQTATHVLLAAGLYACLRAGLALRTPAYGLGGLVKLGVGAGLGVLLAGPQLVPFLEYYVASMGRGLFDAFDTTSPVPRGEALLLMVAPDALGGPHTGDYRGTVGFNMNYNELIGGFVGRLTLVLALVGAWTARRSTSARVLAAVALLGALVAWQVPPFYEAVRAVPVLRETKLARFALFLAFGLATLAALGTSAILARLGPRGARAFSLAAFALVAVDLVSWGRGYNPAIERQHIAPASPTTEFLTADASLHRVLGVDNSILLPNANLFHRIPMISGYDSIESKRTAELVAQLSRRPLAGFEEILAGTDAPRAGFVKEIKFFDRAEAFPLACLLGAKYFLAEGALPAPLELVHEDGGLAVYENPAVRPRAFVARGWRVEPDPERRLALLGSADFDPEVALLEEDPPPGWTGRGAPAAAPGTVEVTSYAPREVRLRARLDAPGLVVLADAWDPGWVARVGGEERPIAVVDHALRGVFVEAGEREIELSYEAASTRTGFLLAGLGLLGTLAIGVGGTRSSRKD